MAINFDQLPQENPNSLPDIGLYKGKILEATMQPNKSEPSKPDYLSLKIALFDKNDKGVGNIYDSISESDKPAIQYKTGRFVRACGLPLTGAMELKDLAKLVVNKNIALEIEHSKPTDKYPNPKAQVKLFGSEVYYLPSEFDEVYALMHPEVEQADFGTMNEVTGDSEETPFDAQDGGAPSTRATY